MGRLAFRCLASVGEMSGYDFIFGLGGQRQLTIPAEESGMAYGRIEGGTQHNKWYFSLTKYHVVY